MLGHRKSLAGKSFAEQQREEVAVLNKEFSDVRIKSPTMYVTRKTIASLYAHFYSSGVIR